MQNGTERAAVVVDSLSKRFRYLNFPKRGTLKEAIVTWKIFAKANHQRYIDALSDVSFVVDKGSAIGVIGPNGSGKSTLLKMIAGVMKPDSGSVKIRGTVTPLLSLGVGFHPDLTGRENVKVSGLIMGLHPTEIEERMEQIAAFAELEDFMDAPVHTYSNGMYMRLAFSLGVSVNPDVLLLDEVFAVGDASFSAKCREQMKRFRNEGTTLVYVSHDLGAVREFCDVALWLDHGKMRRLGPAADVVAAYCRDVGLAEIALPEQKF